MGLNMTYHDTQSQDQYEQKASQVRDTIVDKGFSLRPKKA